MSGLEVRFHHAVRTEFNALPSAERIAMRRVLDLLEQEDDGLDHPYTSHVEGANRVRELRSRAGRSPWRAFYRRIDQLIWIGAFGSKGSTQGLRRAIRLAQERLDAVERGEER